MTNKESGCFLMGTAAGIFLTLAALLLSRDYDRAIVIEKYKSGQIVCAELNRELVCRSAK